MTDYHDKNIQLKPRASRNQTLTLTEAERVKYRERLLCVQASNDPGESAEREAFRLEQLLNRTVCSELELILPLLPPACVDLLILDPPYNLTKKFNSSSFTQRSTEAYTTWFASWFIPLLPVLKPTATVYICGDWRSSSSIFEVASRYLHIQNRITWERDKGRGATRNWKNASEDIWFCTVSNTYTFEVDRVKMMRKVIAPYRTERGMPKDWSQQGDGSKVRLTHPSNLWTDLTVPFWSMPENTDHPTQKPEKLLAKLLLASSQEGDVVLDPFVGSGTTSVVAKKLGRTYIGIERDETYACLTEKRLELAAHNPVIQGYEDGIFRDRNW